MSFMAGFADGFGKTFSAGVERKEQRRDDTFKMMYSDFMKRRDQEDDYRREDSKRVKSAKTLASMVPGVPEGAWVNAYEWLGAGLDEKTILSQLKTGKFSPSEMPAGQTTPAVEQTDAALSPEAQTPVLEQAPAQVPQAQKPAGGFIGEMSSLFTQEEDYAKEAKKRIAESTGLSDDEVTEVLSGSNRELTDGRNPLRYTPGLSEQPDVPDLQQALFNLENARTPEEKRLAESQVKSIKFAEMFEAQTTAQAKARAEGLGPRGGLFRARNEDGTVDYISGIPMPDGSIKEFNGERIFQPEEVLTVEKEEYDSLKRLQELSGDKQYQSYMTKVNTTPQLLRTADQTADLIQQNPGIQGKWTSWLAQTAYNSTADFLYAADLFNGTDPSAIIKDIVKGGKGSQEEYQELKSLEERLQGVLGKGVADMAVAATLRDTRTAIMAYELGRMMGQEGRELQEPERVLFRDLASGGATYEKFMENMGGIINNYISAASDEREIFNEYNTVLATHKKFYGTTNGIELPDILEVIQKTVPKEYERFQKYSPENSERFNTGQGGSAPKAPGLEEAPDQGMSKLPGQFTEDGRQLYRNKDGVIGTLD